MSILPIYTFDHPVLRRKLRPVENVDDELVQLSLDMFETMRNAEGIGLAANQVGRDIALAIVDVSGIEGCESTVPMTLINPVVEAHSDEEEGYEEGCLSLPDLRAEVMRPTGAQIRYFDTSMHERVIEATGLLARVLQHEIDHLNGIYFIDRIKPMRRAMMKRRLLEIKRGEVEADYPLARIAPR